MVAQPLDEFMTAPFLEKTADTLTELGFVADEHEFAPYRETISTHFTAIEQALAARGRPVSLLPGFVEHTRAGYAYFVYDADRFVDSNTANTAVSAWLDQRYS